MAETEGAVDNPANPVAKQSISYIAKIRKLKDAISSKLASSNPSMAVSGDLNIELRLQQFFPTFSTPIHPPYSFMIRQAILKLNQEGGSSEEAISRFIEQEYEGLPWAHASFLSHHLNKLCVKGDVLCVNNERYMLPMDGDGLVDEEKINTLAGFRGSKRWSGVNDGKAKEFENQFAVKPQSIEVNEQSKLCERRIVGSEEHKEGRLGVIEEVQEESENLSRQCVEVEEVDLVKAKLPVMTDQQEVKVLKDDIPQPMLGEGKKHVKEQALQIKGASVVRKPIVLMIDKQEQPREVKISDKGLPVDQQIDIRTEMPVFPCDGEGGGNLKRSFSDCSMHILEKEKHTALKYKRQKKSKLDHIEGNLIVVCALPAEQQSQSRSNVCQKARRLHSGMMTEYSETKESEQILGQQLKLSTPQRSAIRQAPTPESITRIKQMPARMHTTDELQNSQKLLKTSLGTLENLEVLEEKQEQDFQKSEKQLELEIKSKKASFGGKEDQNKQLKVYVRRRQGNPS